MIFNKCENIEHLAPKSHLGGYLVGSLVYTYFERVIVLGGC
jgi:hypothetical protein